MGKIPGAKHAGRPAGPTALRIAVLYILLSVLWIFLSDSLTSLLLPNAELIQKVQLFKGMGFVILSGVFLFFIVFNEISRLEKAKHELDLSRQAYQQIVDTSQEGIWLNDVNGLVTFANPALCAMLGVESGDILQRPISTFVENPEMIAMHLVLPDQAGRQQVDLRFRRMDGSPVWVIASVNTIFNEQGKSVGMMGMAVDITSRKQIENALQSSESRYRYLFENSPIALWEEDFSGIKEYLNDLQEQGVGDFDTYLSKHPEAMAECAAQLVLNDVNRATLLLYGAASKEELQQNFDRILGDGGLDLVRREMVAIAYGARQFEALGVNYKLNGERMDIHLRWAVAPGYEDTLGMVILSVQDISERVKAEQLLKEAEAHFRLLVEQVLAVMYTDAVDEKSTTLYMSPQIEELSGYPAEEWLGNSDLWINRLHPDDRERVIKENQRTNLSGGTFQSEYRLVRSDGHVVWVYDRAVLVWDDTLKQNVWQGVMLDITQRKEAEEALQQSEERFRLLLQTQGEGTVLFDLEGRFEFANPAAAELFGVSLETLLASKLEDYSTRHHAANVIKHLKKLERGESRTVEMSIRNPVIGNRQLLVTMVPWFSTRQELAGGLVVCRDITARKQNERRLRYESTHDPLTGLFNRRMYEERMEQAREGGTRPVSLILADIDRLKEINDRLGHQRGDEVLKRVAQVFKQVFRTQDVVARIGGDEFAVLLTETDEAAAIGALHRLRQQLDKASAENPELPLNVSMGVASTADAVRIPELFHLADASMYADKHNRHVDTPKLAS